MKETTATLLVAACALTGLLFGVAPSAAQSPAPTITVNGAPAASESPPGDALSAPPAGEGSTAESAVPPAAKVVPATTPPPAAKKKSAEVLPWTNKPLAPAATAATGDVAATEAAAAQCSPLFEAACRDLKTCAWVADVALQDGTQVPARCVARSPAPPKKAAAKKQPPPKKAAAPSESTSEATGGSPEAVAAPAVKASVTRVEDEQPAAEPAKEPEKPKKVAKEEAAANAPIVVKPPPPSAPAPSSQMPSFGSVSPIMPGGGDAIVVTVPPSP